MAITTDPTAGTDQPEPAADEDASAGALPESEVLLEEISIDGMCGVY